MITFFKKQFCVYLAIAKLGFFFTTCTTEKKILLGIECITKKTIKQHTKKGNPCVGLITNQTGITQKGLLSVQVLQQKSITVSTIFAPEHGYWGTVPAGNPVQTTVDPISKVPVVSLYAHGAGKNLTKEQVQNIDVLIFDMQDCGMRHFTYISTLYKVMEGCAKYKVPLLVTDRPNPLGGLMEGPLVDPALVSFISIAPIPLRHGMTIGELALYFNKQFFKNSVHLMVVPMKNYTRSLQDFIFFKRLSPNLPNKNAIYGYSFLGLVGEIEPFDVGVGTPYAFQQIGLPANCAGSSVFCEKILKAFLKYGIGSKIVTYTDKKKRTCVGVRFTFNTNQTWSTMFCLKTVLQKAQKTHIPLLFSQSFSKAFGQDTLPKYILGGGTIHNYSSQFSCDLTLFYNKAESCMLYTNKPFVTQR
ncbi:DUF1343 domain-containing protein [Candidatus Dependentiae bacterium]|nr:MAG: DUF1343 domain-containing protein [Candidatus Dependentiae bacterium]